MVDPIPSTDASSNRRDRRAERGRRRTRAVATGIVAALLVVGFGLVLTDVVRFGGGERPSLARTVEAPTPTAVAGTTGSTSTTAADATSCRTPLTDAAPLRLWIGGDSLAGSLGPALGAMSGATGVVQPQFDSRPGSGINHPASWDWIDYGAKEMVRLDPEVAVFIIGANDFPVPLDTREDEHGNPVWKANYTARIEAMLTALGEQQRSVIWVTSPPFNDSRNTQIKELDAHMKDVIAKHPKVVFFDTYELFSDDQGRYQASLPPLDEPDSGAVTVRTGDGVHFTQAGAERIGTAVFKVLDAQCKVKKQAVAGVVKPVLQTAGSTQVIGGTSGSGAVVTSPPATSPPTTTTTTTTTAPAATAAPTTSSTTTTTTTTTTAPACATPPTTPGNTLPLC